MHINSDLLKCVSIISILETKVLHKYKVNVCFNNEGENWQVIKAGLKRLQKPSKYKYIVSEIRKSSR